MLFLANIRERLTIVSLDDQDYFEVLEASSELGIAGGAIDDALLAHCAVKAKGAGDLHVEYERLRAIRSSNLPTRQSAVNRPEAWGRRRQGHRRFFTGRG
jgi:hypothetical protein